MMVVAVGLAALAGYLLQKKQKSLTQADAPTTIATRGTPIPVLLGLRRIGPVFGWAGDRVIRQEKVSGAKGGLFGPTPKQDVYYEAGWHQLCVGPAWALHLIRQHGKVIWKGPITRDTHPSGSLIDVGTEGKFRIFWGERTQALNTFLGSASRNPVVGITSRWPYLCSVMWEEKRLGNSPSWPLLTYDLEVKPESSEALLPSTPAYFPPALTLSLTPYDIDSVVNGAEWNGSNNTIAGQFIVEGDQTQFFPGTSWIRLTGNTLADQDFQVKFSVAFQNQVSAGPPAVFETLTRVFVEGGLAGADANGTITPYISVEDDGYNGAHLIAELIFGVRPVGLERPTNDWDLTSLDELGELLEDEDLRCSIISRGQSVRDTLGQLLQDLGVFMPCDPITGLIKFTAIRPPLVVRTIDEDNLDHPAPEILNMVGETHADRLVFTFPDRLNAFNDMPVQIDDDGNASYGENHSAEEVSIASTCNYGTASKIAERRSQEMLTHASTLTDLLSGRDARSLSPGDVVTVPEFVEQCRVIESTPRAMSGQVGLNLIPDYYGAIASAFQPPPPNTGGGLLPAELDLAVEIVELPEHFDPNLGQAIIVPRIRAHAQVSRAMFYLSRDNISYTQIDSTTQHQTGGDLVDALAADGPMYVNQGPQIDVLGPDFDLVNSIMPLSDADWRLGRVICIIGNEILFPRDVQLIIGTTYRLIDVFRARFDTDRSSHLVGADVLLFENTAILVLQDVLLQPDVDLYVKVPIQASGGSISLAAATPHSTRLEGKGARPIKPRNLYLTLPFPMVPAWVAGGGFTLRWHYASTASPKTGAGQQPAGTVIPSPSAVQGDFRVELQNGATIIEFFPGTVTTQAITNGNLVAGFGSEPSSLTARVFNRDGGLESLPRELSLIRI